jgi:adenylate cyclase class IV
MPIKKCEIRAVVNPRTIRLKLGKLGAKKIKVSKGTDFYFNKELFENGSHLRLRKQSIIYPTKKDQFFLTLKLHYPNFRNMNVYRNITVAVDNFKSLKDLSRKIHNKEIFIEKWKNCEEFKINGTKIELFYLEGWNWLIEIEDFIEKSERQTYEKFLNILKLFGLNEKSLTSIEPAQHLFNKKYE